MPDLVTHTAIAYLVSRQKRWQKYRYLFYVGAILPDVLSRPFYILWPKAFKLTTATHTPIFVILFCLLFAQFFAPTLRKVAFYALLAGSGLHFFLDLLQRHLIGGYFWFFPFSWSTFEIGLFWPETPVQWLPIWLVIVPIVEWACWRAHRVQRS